MCFAWVAMVGCRLFVVLKDAVVGEVEGAGALCYAIVREYRVDSIMLGCLLRVAGALL